MNEAVRMGAEVFQALKKNLKNCAKIVLFAATAGVGFDRLVRRYERLSPAAALWYQSIGAAYVEGVCDAFCADLKKEFGDTRPRFSPGYGDLPLTLQAPLLAVTDAEKRLGVHVHPGSCLLLPVKTVTALAGIASAPRPARIRGCAYCQMRENCALRKGGTCCALES